MAKFVGNWFMSNFIDGTDSSDEIFGMGFIDFLHGNGGADIIHGGGGDDQIFGEDGRDKLFGDEGNDKLSGGEDNDTLDGGKGDDELFGDGDQDTFVDIHGNNAINGGAGIDTVDYSGFFGGRVRVFLSDASPGFAIRDDLIRSADGSSHFLEDSRDRLVLIENVIGTSGDDFITGNSAANVIRGGAGVDLLGGGGGADTFRFLDGDLSNSGTENITDFDALDIIDFSGIDARTDVSGNNAFRIVSSFTGTSGEMILSSVPNGTTVFADTDGDGRSDFHLRITDVVVGPLTVSDFIL